jgi:hypothetical protein
VDDRKRCTGVCALSDKGDDKGDAASAHFWAGVYLRESKPDATRCVIRRVAQNKVEIEQIARPHLEAARLRIGVHDLHDRRVETETDVKAV